MSLLYVDTQTCISCGACAAVCPTCIIQLEEGIPAAKANRCLACGQCVAVCPVAALDNEKSPRSEQTPISEPPLSPAAAEQFLRSRRSIRHYQPEPVPHDKILMLLNLARMAPTGSNSQRVSYHVIDRPDTLTAIRTAVIEWMEEQIAAGSPYAPYLRSSVNEYRQSGRDVILRDAPTLLLALADADFFPRGRDNGHFALTYAELYAPSLGFGTCWAGYLEACAQAGYLPLLKLLDLPDGKAVAGALMAGFPKYTYHRLVDRDPLTVTWQ